jgi:hypothetical protein
MIAVKILKRSVTTVGTSLKRRLSFMSGLVLVKIQASSRGEYGDKANVFGKITNKSGFKAYAGSGFALLIPSKWNPSREYDFANVSLRYEDNFDAVNNLIVLKEQTDKNSIEGYGTPDQFLYTFSYLLGQQSYSGATISEGGFAPDRVAAASLLDVESSQDEKGKTSYRFNILTRTADGDEGGRHQLIAATVSNKYLYILKVQVGDKRWFKGARKEAEGSFNSFTVV